MNLLRQYRFASFLLVLLAIAAFSIAELDFALLFVAGTLATLSWYVTEGPRGRTLPDWAANAIIVAILAWSAFDFAARGELTDAMGALGRFLLSLLVVKLFARRTVNEDRQRLSLATMIVVAGCLQSVQFVFGILVLAYAAVAVWTAMLWRMHASAEAARAERRASEGFAPPLELVAGRRAGAQFRGSVAVAIVTTFAVSAVCFVLFPRFAEIGDRGPRGSRSSTGFTDEIRLLDVGRITESRRELFTLRWTDAGANPQRSLRPLLLRGAVLDRYDASEQRWGTRRGAPTIRTLRTQTEGRFTALAAGPLEARAGVYTAEVQMRSFATDVMFSLYAPIAISTSESRTVALEPSTLLLRDVSTDRIGRYWSYSILVQPQPGPETLALLAGGPGAPPRPQEFPVAAVEPIARGILAEVERTANLPPYDPATATPAEMWTRNREVARAIASWMKSRFDYTTDLSGFVRVEGEDPIVSFLTRYRAGHCEYFASALCAVLRSLGIESRVVTGFIAIEYDENAEHYVVRESNAHAWVEVRSGEHAWIAVDATPEESLIQIQEKNRSFADRFRWIYDRIEFLWNSRVVTYDSSTQATIANRVQQGWWSGIAARLERVSVAMRALASDLSLGRAGGLWFAVIAIGLSTAGLAALIVAVNRRRLRLRLRIDGLDARERRRLLRDAAFYADALEALDRAGLGKPAHETPAAHARTLGAGDAALGSAFGAIAEAFYRVRYGGVVPGQDQAKAHSALVSELRGLLRQKRAAPRAD
ncbi:MAG: DUF3488 and transglutaminase-like domain-containing protein [Planctomycetota bacterium]